MKRTWWAAAVLTATLSGCTAPGSEGGPCLAGSCNSGLVCLSDTCVNPNGNDAGSSDGGGTGKLDGGSSQDGGGVSASWKLLTNVPGNGFRGVFGFGPNDVWVSSGTGVAHWNGSDWQEYPAGSAGAVMFAPLWGSAPDDVWLGGDNAMYHWDGTGWNQDPADFGVVFGVWGSGPNDVWAVGDVLFIGGGLRAPVAHWDGATWTGIKPAGYDKRLDAIHGSGPNDVWAVGNAGQAFHWNGATWTSRPVGGYPTAVWVRATDDAWLTGGGSPSGIMRWNGITWSPVTSTGQLWTIFGTSKSDVWAGGNEAALLHWDGLAWSPASTGITCAQGLVCAVQSLWASGPSDAWAVGDFGLVRYH